MVQGQQNGPLRILDGVAREQVNKWMVQDKVLAAV